MWPFKTESFPKELNELRTRVDRLEVDSAARQLEVLKTVNTVLNQMRALERKRAAQEPVDEAAEAERTPTHPNRLLEARRKLRGF